MSRIAPGFEGAVYGGTPSNTYQINLGNGAERQLGEYANNSAEALADTWADLGGVPSTQETNPDTIGPDNALGHIASGHYTDYHFRIWIIPNVLSLSNPQIDTPIPFNIWQTYPTSQTLQDIDVEGSDALTFGLEVDDVLHDHEYLTTYLQIADSEALIDATITFVFDDSSGVLTLLATVSETFDLVFDTPVTETWDFLTNVLTSYNNKEQRISLRPKPRITLDLKVSPIDLAERRRIYSLLMRNMKVRALVPFFQYSVNANGITDIGTSKLFFNPALTNMREGHYLIVLNPGTEEVFLAEIDTLESDGAIVSSASSFRIDEKWLVAPAYNCLLQDGAGFTVNSISSTMNIQAESIVEPDLSRPGTSETVNTFDGFPILEKRPLAGAEEKFIYRRDVIDNQTGVREISSAWPLTVVGGVRRFNVSRYTDPDLMDYWREFFDLVRGAHKRFLMSTWLHDLTLAEVPTQGTSSFIINESEYVTVYYPFETFKHIQVETNNGSIYNATVTSASTDSEGVTSITFTPALPDEPHTTDIARISYLNIVRAADKIRLEHYDTETLISFVIRQVEE